MIAFNADRVPPQVGDRGVSKRIVRDSADHVRPMAKACEPNGDVRLRSADVNIEAAVLKQ